MNKSVVQFVKVTLLRNTISTMAGNGMFASRVTRSFNTKNTLHG